MSAAVQNSLALIIRSAPYARRSARSQLDMALAAAAVDIELEVYFIGAAVLQLALGRNPSGALLPAGYRGWGGLQQLAHEQSPASVFAEREWLSRCREADMTLCVEPEALNARQMQQRWRRCQRVLVI